MAVERTLSIIKPDAVRKNLIGAINSRFEQAGLSIVAMKMLQMDQKMAGDFYAAHCQQPFYDELVTFMTSGPVVAQVLEGEDAIARNRQIMGATNPAQADPGTIRADFAASIGENAVHGSDGPDTAKQEVAFFFTNNEICPRS